MFSFGLKNCFFNRFVFGGGKFMGCVMYWWDL